MGSLGELKLLFYLFRMVYLLDNDTPYIYVYVQKMLCNNLDDEWEEYHGLFHCWCQGSECLWARDPSETVGTPHRLAHDARFGVYGDIERRLILHICFTFICKRRRRESQFSKVILHIL